MIFSPKLVAHYRELKAQAPDCLLLMQVGTFMDVLDQDARTVAEVTGLNLRMAGEVNDPVVMILTLDRGVGQ
jgi:DNA mismatch repair ATPase MutS